MKIIHFKTSIVLVNQPTKNPFSTYSCSALKVLNLYWFSVHITTPSSFYIYPATLNCTSIRTYEARMKINWCLAIKLKHFIQNKIYFQLQMEDNLTSLVRTDTICNKSDLLKRCFFPQKSKCTQQTSHTLCLHYSVS